MSNLCPIVLSCCGNIIDENYKYKGHASYHLLKKERIPCPHPSCNHQSTTEDSLTRHISTQHPEVSKSIIGLKEPEKVNMFDMMNHMFQNRIPVSRNLFSLPEYRANPITEQYIEDLNNMSRSQNEEVANSIFNEMDQSNNDFHDQLVEEQLNPNQVEIENEDFLFEQREQITSSFDGCTLDQQLSQLQIDLADGYNQVKDQNVITDTALKSACTMMLNVLSKHLNISDLAKKQANDVIKSDYILQKRRNVAKFRFRDFGESGKVYYFNIKDYLEEMVKNDVIWRKLLSEKNKVRNDDIIETIHDLEKVKEIDRSIGQKEINVFYNLWFDDFNTSTRTFGNTNLSAVLLSMASVEYKFTTKRHSAGLVALSKKSTRDKVSIMTYFEDIRNQIKNMQPIEHNGYKVFFRFFCVKADNKAANEMIINIPKSFTGTSACKFCKTNYNDLKTERNHELRCLLAGHVFDGCEFFTRTLYAPDIFHDVCESN